MTWLRYFLNPRPGKIFPTPSSTRRRATRPHAPYCTSHKSLSPSVCLSIEQKRTHRTLRPLFFFLSVRLTGFAMKGGKSKADAKKSDGRLAVKKKGEKMSKAAKKAAKDPNKPKRPASAFFVFMEEFRKTYKEKHPANKSVAQVGKAGGDKWKSMSDAEKAPYVEKAEKRKVEYTKNMNAYNKKLAEGPTAADEEESDKSKSEVHDDDEDDDESGEEDEDDD